MKFLERWGLRLGISFYGVVTFIATITIIGVFIRLFGGLLKGFWWNIENWLG